MGRTLMVAGAVLFVAGLAIAAIDRLGLPIGKLPGDFTWRGKNTTVYFPLASSILASLLLTLVLWLFQRR